MLQVTKDNFSAVLPIVEQALKHCQFYAFDCEMTGLKHTYNDSISYYADMQERYAQVRSLAEPLHQLTLTNLWNDHSQQSLPQSHLKPCSVLQLPPESPAACTATKLVAVHVVFHAGCSQRQRLLALPVWVVSLLLAGRQIRGPDVQFPLVPQVTRRWRSQHNDHLGWSLSCYAAGCSSLVCMSLSCLQHFCTLSFRWGQL